MVKRGLIHIYTGDGKGKTTAAVGLAVRARGHGLRVVYLYFHKDPKRWGYGEHKILKRVGVDVFGFACRHPHFHPVRSLGYSQFGSTSNGVNIRKECLKGLRFVKAAYKEKRYDVMILDEVNISVRDGFIKKGELLDIIKTKPAGLELVLTGRGATKGMIEAADLVSKIEKIKHPYDSGTRRRAGVEY
jgi:cob(I)alamin adenosyltransferase